MLVILLLLAVAFLIRCTCYQVPLQWRSSWRIRDLICCLPSQDHPAN